MLLLLFQLTHELCQHIKSDICCDQSFGKQLSVFNGTPFSIANFHFSVCAF